MALPTIHTAPLNLIGAYFVTGTDTEIGKTTTTANLVKALAKQGQAVYAIKPVTAGLATDANGEPYSEDARQINQFATVTLPMSAIAPICLATPCSPHIASQLDNVELQADTIVNAIQTTLQTYPADTVLIEGAGGWFTPINASETLADVAMQLGLPVIMVVGIKLGSLNHAMLTLQAIWQAGLTVDMVVFNALANDTAFLDEQIRWLTQAISRQAVHYQAMPPQWLFQDFNLPLNEDLCNL
ncbi:MULTISPECIES: dethiobiotin synthase [unclassified Moraxella]|uniref:dethiobiotin synthase n=1 Tax=unclassified Moraxella TaxID=2685852 RepID=UPI003AF865F6